MDRAGNKLAEDIHAVRRELASLDVGFYGSGKAGGERLRDTLNSTTLPDNPRHREELRKRLHEIWTILMLFRALGPENILFRCVQCRELRVLGPQACDHCLDAHILTLHFWQEVALYARWDSEGPDIFSIAWEGVRPGREPLSNEMAATLRSLDLSQHAIEDAMTARVPDIHVGTIKESDWHSMKPSERVEAQARLTASQSDLVIECWHRHDARKLGKVLGYITKFMPRNFILAIQDDEGLPPDTWGLVESVASQSGSHPVQLVEFRTGDLSGCQDLLAPFTNSL